MKADVPIYGKNGIALIRAELSSPTLWTVTISQKSDSLPYRLLETPKIIDGRNGVLCHNINFDFPDNFLPRERSFKIEVDAKTANGYFSRVDYKQFADRFTLRFGGIGVMDTRAYDNPKRENVLSSDDVLLVSIFYMNTIKLS